MSLATTCPACGTAFRVTPEQLSAHRGDVRCGQCQHIFNALNQLMEVPAIASVAPPSQPVQPGKFPEADVENDPPQDLEGTLAEDFAATVILPTAEETEAAVEEESTVDSEPEQVEEVVAKPVEPEDEALVELDTENLDLELTAPADDEVEPAAPLPENSSTEEDADSVLAAAMAPEPLPKAAEFLVDKPKRRLPNWLLALFSLLLLLALAGQTAYFMRTEIASNFPPAKPWLDRGCLLLGCTVELPRHVDMFVIEDSDLKDDADHDGVMVLTYVLYNRAPYPQAYPLLELTLTDTFDKPVLRHTFTPQEYLPKGTDVAAGIGASSEANSQLHLTVSGEKPAGYRLWVKY